MIAIVDYGVGNLFSLKSSLDMLGLKAEVTSDKTRILRAKQVILPGVGAFGDAAKKLESSGLKEAVLRVAESGTPILGICLGMQLLFDKSYEYGEHDGLSLIHGKICPLADDIGGLKVPHMGWNSLDIVKASPLMKYVSAGEYVYFVHSYYAKECEKDTVSTSFYGVDVTAVVGRGNVFGTQFHPEKSGDVGLRILKAFGEM